MFQSKGVLDEFVALALTFATMFCAVCYAAFTPTYSIHCNLLLSYRIEATAFCNALIIIQRVCCVDAYITSRGTIYLLADSAVAGLAHLQQAASRLGTALSAETSAQASNANASGARVDGDVFVNSTTRNQPNMDSWRESEGQAGLQHAAPMRLRVKEPGVLQTPAPSVLEGLISQIGPRVSAPRLRAFGSPQLSRSSPDTPTASDFPDADLDRSADGISEGTDTTSSAPTAAPAADPFNGFSMVLMSASPSACAAVIKALEPSLRAYGFSEPLDDIVTILPIPAGAFTQNLGLEAYGNYYMLLMRNILPSNGGLQAFREYLASQPLAAFRITRKRRSAAVSAFRRRFVGNNVTAIGAQLAPLTGSYRNEESSDLSGIGQIDDLQSRSWSEASNSAAQNTAAASTAASPGTMPANRSEAQQLDTYSAPPERDIVGSDDKSADIARGAIASAVDLGDPDAAQLESAPPVNGQSSVTLASVFPAPQLISRSEPQRRSEAWLGPALERLITAATESYESQFSIRHSIGSASALGIVGIDSGLDCLTNRVDYCNGDNRCVQTMMVYYDHDFL